jgi:hypothetical protein
MPIFLKAKKKMLPGVWVSMFFVSTFFVSPLIQGPGIQAQAQAQARNQNQNSQPVVGRKAAEKYWNSSSSQNSDYQSLGPEEGGSTRQNFSRVEFLTLNLGAFIDSQSYLWGRYHYPNVGRANYGVTYLFDQWYGFDRHLRIEFSEYQVQGESPRKLSVLPLVTFPRLETQFPLYFGFGAGFGIFFNQLKGESDLSLDYQLVTGLRFFDVFDQLGFFIELAMKNHLFLLSDGQFNGTALNTGMVFTF